LGVYCDGALTGERVAPNGEPRRNAALFAPAHIRRSPAWAWLGWVVPIVSLFFPKQMVDDCWQITSRAIPGAGPRSRYLPTALWWPYPNDPD
jgi:hypothetical protein